MILAKWYLDCHLAFLWYNKGYDFYLCNCKINALKYSCEVTLRKHDKAADDLKG